MSTMTLADVAVTYLLLSCLFIAAILVRGIWLWLLNSSEEARTDLKSDARVDRLW